MPYTILTTVFLLFFLLCWMLPLHFRLYYRREKTNDHFIIDTTALGKIICYQLKIPVSDLTRWKQGIPWLTTKIESRGGETESQTVAEQEKSWKWLCFTWHNFAEVQEKVDRLLVAIDDYSDFMGWVTNKIRFERFNWVTRIGRDDAAETAIVVGGCWAIKSYITAVLWHRYCCCTTVRPLISVIPDYNQETFDTDFECIFRIRLGHIIGAGIRLLRYKI